MIVAVMIALVASNHCTHQSSVDGSTKNDLLPSCGFIPQLVRALHWYRRCPGWLPLLNNFWISNSCVSHVTMHTTPPIPRGTLTKKRLLL